MRPSFKIDFAKIRTYEFCKQCTRPRQKNVEAHLPLSKPCAFGLCGNENLLRFALKMVGPMVLFLHFLVLFMSLTTIFNTIHGSYCTISTNFYFCLQYFQ